MDKSEKAEYLAMFITLVAFMIISALGATIFGRGNSGAPVVAITAILAPFFKEWSKEIIVKQFTKRALK